MDKVTGSYTITLDDDPTVSLIVEHALNIKNFSYSESKKLIEDAPKLSPLGVIVDVHLDGECGLDIIPTLRAFWPSAAIIVVTMDESAEVIQQALASGADDFIRKPVNAIELVARLKIRIDRNKDTVANTVFENGDLRLDVKHKMLKGNNGYMQLSQRETELLAHLIRSDGVVISKDVLKRELWGSVKVTDNALDRKIFEVRKAVKTVSTEMVLQSVYGRGIFLRSRTYSEDRILLDDIDRSE